MKTCKFCGEQIQSEATKCRFCGEWQKEEKESLEKKNSTAIEYFSVSLIKLAIMSIISLGLYDFYWFYKNWQKIFAQEKKEKAFFSMSAGIRALPIFNLFYCYSLFGRIIKSAKELGYKTNFSILGLYLFYIFAILFNRADNLVFLITFLRIFPLLAIQQAINFNNQKINPDSKINSRLFVAEIIIALLGISFLALRVYGNI